MALEKQTIQPVRLRERVGTISGYAAGALNLIAFIWYCTVVFSGNAETNPITWWLWLAETAISLTLYVDRTRDMSKWLAEAVSMLGVVVVSVYLAFMAITGGAAIVFAGVEPIDYFATAFAVLAFCVWLATRKKHGAGIALWVFQLALLSAIFPLVRSTLANPSAEPLEPWALWTVAFFLQSLCAGLKWDGVDTLMSPVNYTITHGVVTSIVLFHVLSM